MVIIYPTCDTDKHTETCTHECTRNGYQQGLT